MPTLARTASILAIAVLTAGPALADGGHHGRDASGPLAGAGMPVSGDPHETMHEMMRLVMTQMHGSGEILPGMGPTGGPGTPGMSMMDRGMMQMMTGPDMMDGMPQGMPGRMMQSRLEEYDADGDGRLSLEEFSAWHAAMMRETMVDRFQHLDADGDGAITSDEMNALAGRVNRMRDADVDARPMMRGMPEQN